MRLLVFWLQITIEHHNGVNVVLLLLKLMKVYFNKNGNRFLAALACWCNICVIRWIQ